MEGRGGGGGRRDDGGPIGRISSRPRPRSRTPPPGGPGVANDLSGRCSRHGRVCTLFKLPRDAGDAHLQRVLGQRGQDLQRPRRLLAQRLHRAFWSSTTGELAPKRGTAVLPRESPYASRSCMSMGRWNCLLLSALPQCAMLNTSFTSALYEWPVHRRRRGGLGDGREARPGGGLLLDQPAPLRPPQPVRAPKRPVPRLDDSQAWITSSSTRIRAGGGWIVGGAVARARRAVRASRRTL